MNTKKILASSLAVTLAIAVTVMLIAGRKTASPVAEGQVIQPPTNAASVISESAPPAETPAIESKPQIQPAPTNILSKTKPKKVTAQGVKVAKAKDPIQDPMARAALSFVGSDPAAEQYWVGAINDPGLSAQERQDLIEDLNEDGLSDPKHPGPQDLPLILNRLQLIAELSPYALDQVNADAFAEAYKDLNNMLAGKPVQ